VGAHENSASPYGTFDQGGNVFEWNEAVISVAYRGVRGGAFDNDSGQAAAYRDYANPPYESHVIGFRVAKAPEPGSIVVFALGGFSILRRKRRPSQGAAA
jgi:formylglycine-generating enzyme required for sulfatase activity